VSLKRKLAEGSVVVGAWVFTPSPAYVELAAANGLDFLLFDLEHGTLTLDHVEGLMRVLRGSGTQGIVRVPSHDATLVARVLDRGAHGVVIPRVDDPETAARLAAAARFPPNGTRGLAIGALGASRYGTDGAYRSRADEETLVAMQIESRVGLEHCMAIATAPGVDVAFIGPGDLAADMRLEGPANAAALCAAIDGAAEEMRRNGVILATVPHGGRGWRELVQSGFQMLVPFSDIGALRDGLAAASNDVAEWRRSAGVNQ
jgi:4-hydroxy-2-oxoheptanedioate aldolase